MSFHEQPTDHQGERHTRLRILSNLRFMRLIRSSNLSNTVGSRVEEARGYEESGVDSVYEAFELTFEVPIRGLETVIGSVLNA